MRLVLVQEPLQEQQALHLELHLARLQEPVLQVMYRTAGQRRRL
jgi:hypothetical protein